MAKDGASKRLWAYTILAVVFLGIGCFSVYKADPIGGGGEEVFAQARTAPPAAGDAAGQTAKPAETQSQAEESASTSAASGSASSEPDSSAAPPPAPVPKAVNPLDKWDVQSPVFTKNMKEWGEGLSHYLERENEVIPKGKAKAVPSPPDGVVISLSRQAAARVKSADFGEKKRDKAIFLQYMACKAGAITTVDGWFGKRSRAAVKTAIQASAPSLNEEEASRRVRELRQYFAN